MLGDNRAYSYDGRFWGPLDKKQFIGKTTFRFWPLNRIKRIKAGGNTSYNQPQ